MYFYDAWGDFKTDFEIEFFVGKLISAKTYDNSKSRKVTHQNQELQKNIYGNIDWVKLPKIEKPIRVILEFFANENGKIDSVRVIRGENEIFNQEAVRVMKSVDLDFDVLYRRGKHFRVPKMMPFVFSEENREKYNK
jgi:hypothetical protein